MKLYVDTSVFGGIFDEEFRTASELFFEGVRRGHYQLIISSLTETELEPAPQFVREFVSSFAEGAVYRINVDAHAEDLARQYIAHGAVSVNSYADAQHIAAATLSQADLLVSWNFKHIVNIFRIRKYNSVNVLLGYRQLEIRSPSEVIYDSNN